MNSENMPTRRKLPNDLPNHCNFIKAGNRDTERHDFNHDKWPKLRLNLHIQTWSTVLRFSEADFLQRLVLYANSVITWKFIREYTNLWNQTHRKESSQHSDSEKFPFHKVQERRQAVWLKSNFPLAPSLFDGRDQQIIINELLLIGRFYFNQTEKTYANIVSESDSLNKKSALCDSIC